MTIFNVIAFGGDASTGIPETDRPSTWTGKTFVLVQGATGSDFAVYWQLTSAQWSPEQIAFGGRKISAFRMKGSELHFFLQHGLIQEMPDDWYYRA